MTKAYPIKGRVCAACAVRKASPGHHIPVQVRRKARQLVQHIIQRVGQPAVEALRHQQAHQPRVQDANLAGQAKGRGVKAQSGVLKRLDAHLHQGLIAKRGCRQPQAVPKGQRLPARLKRGLHMLGQAVANTGPQVHGRRRGQNPGVQKHMRRRPLQKQEGVVALHARLVQDVFAQFATYHQSDMKRLFQNILRYHKALPEVRFHCPSGVETASWEKDGKTILHLVNMVGGMGLCTGTMDNFEGRYQRTFEFIDELIPVHGVTVDIAATAMPVISKVLEAGSPPPEVKIEQTAEGYRLHIQKVERWVTLVIG